MIFSIILFLISLFLEILMPSLVKEFIPFFVLTSILISSFLIDNEKNFYILLLIFGIIYDLACTNALLLHSFLFVAIGFIIKKMIKDKNNFIKTLLIYYIEIFIYISFMIFFTFFYSNINYMLLINKIFNSLPLNTIYFLLAHFNFIGIKCLVSNTKKNHSYF